MTLNNEIFTDKELVIAILYYSKGYTTLKTRLTKLLFVFTEIFKINDLIPIDLDFIPYNYGPTLTFEGYNLLLSPLKSIKLIKIIRENQNPHQKERISFIEENLDKNLSIIKEKLIGEKPQDKTELVKELCDIFDQDYNINLIQFVYFLREDFTRNSRIKKDVEKFPLTNLQNKLIRIITKIRVRYLIRLLEYIPGILKIYDFNTEISDFPLNKIFDIFREGLKKNNLENKDIKELISIIDHACLTKPTYYKLKESILDLLLFNKFDQFDNEIIISLLVFILKSLQLKWPLDSIGNEKHFKLRKHLFENAKFFYHPENDFDVLEKSKADQSEIDHGLDYFYTD